MERKRTHAGCVVAVLSFALGVLILCFLKGLGQRFSDPLLAAMIFTALIMTLIFFLPMVSLRLNINENEKRAIINFVNSVSLKGNVVNEVTLKNSELTQDILKSE